MKKILTTILLIVSTYMFSQTTELNLEKYWAYRERLKSKFLVSINPFSTDVPHSLGTNIPASSYNPTDYYHEDWSIEVSTAKAVKWGDATSHLGYYIGVLATEYALLKANNQDYVGTVNELIWSLATIERLDHNAETYYGWSCPFYYTYGNQDIYVYPYDDNCFNGFFVRDDIPEDFVSYWRNRGYDAFNSVDRRISDSQKEDDNEMSQDQVWELMFGLALVKKLVDLPNTFNDGDGEQVTLKMWAQKITYRLIKYMHSAKGVSVWEPCGLGEDCWPGHWVNAYFPAWIINNPTTLQVVKRGGSIHDLLPHAHLFAEAGNWITENQFGSLHYEGVTEWLIGGDLPWAGTYTNDDGEVFTFSEGIFFNDNAKLVLSTIANTIWGHSVESLLYNMNRCAQYYNATLPDNKNDCKIFTFDHYPMYRIVLHDEIPEDYYFDYYMSYIENVLNLAPVDGPSRYIYDKNGNGSIGDSDDYSVREWATDNRAYKPIGVSLNDGEDPGEYNGLDYMIIHNLYWLAYSKVYNKTRTISETIPYTYSSTYGTLNFNLGQNDNETIFKKSSFKDIEANNIINGNSKITYKAESTIKLLPGFHAKTGADFHAYIDNFKELAYSKSSFKTSRSELNVIDEMPWAEPIYYRKKETNHTLGNLEEVNKNAKADQKNINIAKEISVFPNPSSSTINVQIGSNQQVHSMEIYNSKGIVVKELDCIEKTSTIDISGYSNGVYFIQILTDDGIITKKFIKK